MKMDDKTKELASALADSMGLELSAKVAAIVDVPMQYICLAVPAGFPNLVGTPEESGFMVMGSDMQPRQIVDALSTLAHIVATKIAIRDFNPVGTTRTKQ
jgi:hypothetical protein